MNLFHYFIQEHQQISILLLEHIKLTIIAVGFAILIGVPLGLLISYISKVSRPVLMIANVIQAIPSMALLGFMIPLFGIGSVPAIIVVTLYSLLPIIKNTYTGIESVRAQLLEAAKGIGLTGTQILFKVQLPIALPVIMAGVRVAAVTSVGLMTMAAFIGAGGLGNLVFSGIRTMNNVQILAGAIPACILALIVDAILGYIEKKVTPKSARKNTKPKSKWHYRLEILLNLVLIFAFISVVGYGISSTYSKDDKKITVGSKDYTEQSILGNLIAEYIEDQTDIKVEKKLELGGTQVCFGALKTKDIDLYVEYSGSAYSDILKHPADPDVELVYQTVKDEMKKDYDIDVLQQMNFNNTFTLAIPQKTAKKYHLSTIEDLGKVANQFVLGSTFEFLNREDGLLGVQKFYNFTFKDSIPLDSSLRYQALQKGDVMVIDAYSTDGLLKKFHLKTLEDNQKFFPPYYAIPMMRSDVAQKYPEIIPLLERLGEELTDETMQELNYQVDELHKDPNEVAVEFLKSHNLIDK